MPRRKMGVGVTGCRVRGRPCPEHGSTCRASGQSMPCSRQAIAVREDLRCPREESKQDTSSAHEPPWQRQVFGTKALAPLPVLPFKTEYLYLV